MNINRKLEGDFIERLRLRNLLPKGSSITAAVSGGGDSVALLLMLSKFSSHMDWDLKVLHVDHGTRDSAKREADFVRSMAEDFGLEFILKHLQSSGKVNLEGFWSFERNRIYQEITGDGSYLATGHTADDRAETLLIRLLEGAGLRGLGGMDYFGVGRIRRPLLDFRRKDLRRYLRDNGMKWMEDPSNSSEEFLRNRIRHRVIPVLEEISAGSVKSLATSSANLAQWRDAVDRLLQECGEELLQGNKFAIAGYSELPKSTRIGFLWTVAEKPRGGRYELEKTDRWLLSGKNGSHTVPGGVRLIVENGYAIIEEPPSSNDTERAADE